MAQKTSSSYPVIRERKLTATQAQRMASGFAALGDPVRLRLFSLIATAGEICACDLVEPLGKSQPTISHHLKTLFDAGLVNRERRGTWIWYSIANDRLDDLQQALR